MNSKKAKGRARLLRKMRAQQLATSAAVAATDAEIERLGRQIEAANARGEKIILEKMSVKDRKRLRRATPLISEAQREQADLARTLVAKAQASETGGKCS